MKTGLKTAIALAFVGVVAMAAAAFGQSGDPSGSPSPGDAPRARADKPAGLRHRAIHSETKVQTADGFATVIADFGEVTSVSGNTVTIKRVDDETVTVTATGDTKVMRNGEQASVSDIKAGDRAHIVQVVEDGATTVRAIRAADENFTPERKHGPKRRLRGPRPGAPADAPADAPAGEDASFFAA